MSQITNDLKMNIDFYEYENELLTVVIGLALISLTLVMVLNYYNFLNFWGDVGKESNFVIEIFIYASDSSHYTLSDMFVFIVLFVFRFRYINVWS